MKYKVVCVNYLNTKPLIRGLQQDPYHKYFEIIPENPRVCSERFISGFADIALVPVAVLANDITDYNIISDYCIGSEGPVGTVGIFGNTELKDINKIYLDDHSKTSQQLARIIFEDYLNIKPSYEIVDVTNIEPKRGEGVLMIGDKAFSAKERFSYYYDLAELWTKFTSLPFVFAVWISRHDDLSIEKLFNEGVKLGLSQMDIIIEENKSLHPSIDLRSYYSDNIKFNLDDAKQDGLALFLKLLKAKSIPSLS